MWDGIFLLEIGDFMAELITAVSIMLLPKNLSVTLGESLEHLEFRCKCSYTDCNHTLVSNDLLFAWNGMRSTWMNPLIVNSGFRCQKHNKKIGGIDKSSHMTGLAIDISTYGMGEQEKTDLEHHARIYFDYVKVYKTFIHCQISR